MWFLFNLSSVQKSLLFQLSELLSKNHFLTLFYGTQHFIILLKCCATKILQLLSILEG